MLLNQTLDLWILLLMIMIIMRESMPAAVVVAVAVVVAQCTADSRARSDRRVHDGVQHHERHPMEQQQPDRAGVCVCESGRHGQHSTSPRCPPGA